MDRFGRRRAVDIVLEIGENLEVLAHLGIERSQDVVENAVAEQDDLDIERDRIGLDRDRAGQAEKMADVLDPDLALAQRPLERRPAERLHQQVSHVEQQIAAIGPVHRAGFDQPEIGHQHAVLRDVFDIAQKVAERRMQLFDDRDVARPVRDG